MEERIREKRSLNPLYTNLKKENDKIIMKLLQEINSLIEE